MPKLIAVILTKNEAHHIGDCIASVRAWVDAVIVWDSVSSDATCSLARQAGALVVQRPFDHWAGQRQAVLDSVAAEWVFFVDADERVTPALGQEIGTLLAAPQANGYWVPRRNLIVGQEMRAGGFFPDYQLRLLRRGYAHYIKEREVHEVVDVGEKEAWLTEPLIHYNYASWRQFFQKQRFYARHEARILAGRGIRPRPHNFVLQPLREFRRRFITLAGWRDGLYGFVLALLLAWFYGFMPYWLLATQAIDDRRPTMDDRR